MSIAELPDNATHEQINEYVDKIVADEQKAADETETPAEQTPEKPQETAAPDTTEQTEGVEQSADSDAAAEQSGEDSEQHEEESTDWLTDDVKAEYSTLGIDDEQLSKFSSRDELDRALSLLDSAAMKAGRQAAESRGEQQQKEPVQQETPRGPDGKFAPKEQSKDEPAYKVNLDPENLDGETVVKEFNQLRDYYESRLRAVDERFSRYEQQEQMRAAIAMEQQFDAIVDSLGHPELFGETGKTSKDQQANRQKLFDENDVYLNGLRSLGRTPRLEKALVSRVMNMAFADHLSKQQRKQITDKAKRQSGQRMGMGAARSRDPDMTLDEEMKALYTQLEKQSR